MKAAQVIGNDNVYTCLPISYDTLQTIYNQTCPMAITPTIIKHPEKNISAEIQQDDGMLTNQVINENLVENTDATSLDKMDVSGTTACIINQESILNKKNLPRKRKDNLKCDTCDKKFDKVSIYKKHLLIHQNVKKYKCEHCFESYNIEDNYKLHMALHQKVKPSCPLCKRQFQRLASLKSHLLMHEVEETFVCKECLAEFDREADYHKHVTSHNSTKNVFENIPYICSYCNYLFEDPKDYKEHVSYHIKIKKLVFNPKKARGRTTNNKDYNHRCPVCNKLFPKNCLLERHMRIHSGEKPFVCPKCGKDFTQKNTLQIHMLKYSGHKPYKCTLCPAEFFQKGNLRVHVEKTHTAPPNIDKMYKCTQCTCIFKKIASLNAHITRTHSGIKHIDELADIGDRVKALKEMAEQFSIPNTLNNKSGETPLSEISRVHGLSADTNETFVKLAENSVDGTLRRYIVKQRKAGDTKWFICLYCSKEFKKPSDLIRHIRIHTKEKPYKCKVCNEAFALKSTLLSHLNTHDKREYQCHICSQFFASARTLKVHAKKHNKSGLTLSLKYKCSTCNKLFSTYSKAGTHMEVHNCTNDDIEGNKLWENQAAQIPLKQPMIETVKGLVTLPAPKPRIPHAEMEEYKNRPYKCHKCNAAFMKPTHVKRHMLTHSGERNFKCELCTKAFLTSYALKEHVRFHSSEKKFACSLCPQKFVSKELLKHHQITHSSVKPYICPYCRRRFKTALLCRKHINVHRHTVNELEPMTKVDPAKTIDLVDTLSNNPFNLETINEEGVFWKPEEPDEQQPIADLASHLPEFVEQPITKPIMKPKRIVHRSESKRVVNNNNGFISYNHDIINLANNSDILVSKDGNYTIIMSEGNEIDPSVSNSNIPAMDLDSTAFINYDEYSSVNNDVYNTMLSNVKLQNSDPILMSTIGESQDSNILFMDPTLSQTSEYQSDGQSFETFNRTIFSSTNDLNINVQASNVGSEFIRTNRPTLPTHISDEKPNLSKLNFSESENLQTIGSKKSTIIDTSKSLLTPDQIGLNDNLIIALTEDEFSNVNFNLNNGLTSVADNLNLNIMDVEIQIQNNFMCNICKATFCNAKSLEKHQCIVPLSADLHNGNADDINAMILSEELVNIPQNDQITLITSFNDQLQTAPMEISTDEPANDSTDIRELTDGAQDKERSTSFEIDRWKKLENKCTYCCKSFKKASDLIRHIRTHTGERPFTCNKCNKSFSLKSTLQYHLRTHSDVRSFNFVCPVCESVFSCRATLRIHMRIHTGVKPYPCHMCQLKFRTSSGRKSHLMTHAKNLKRNEVKNNSTQMSRYLDTLVTNDTGNLQVKVEPTNIIVENAENNEIQQIEGLSLDLLQQLQSAGLLIHESNNDELGDGLMQLNYDNILDGKSVKMMMPVQNVDIIEPNIINGIQNNIEPKLKKFECNFCHKTYTTKAVLRKHQKRHKKPFQCSKCDKKFDSQDLLDKHIKLHSGYRPFSCTYCANSFSEEGSLKTHMKRIHNVY